jgi:tRNA uridine 5-carbamoylmethylation protein Kti12
MNNQLDSGVKKVIIMRGIPGSGKSSCAAKIQEDLRRCGHSVDICSADFFFTSMEEGIYLFDLAILPQNHNKCLSEFLGCLQDRDLSAIIVDNTNSRAWEIAPYYRLAEIFHCDVEIVWVQTDPEACKKRNIHGVPDSVIDAMFNTMEAIPPFWKQRVVFN